MIDVLRNTDERHFLLNDETFELLPALRISGRIIEQLRALPQGKVCSEDEFTELLNQYVPNLGTQQRKWILDAAAIGAYRAQTDFPVYHLNKPGQTRSGRSPDCARCGLVGRPAGVSSQ